MYQISVITVGLALAMSAWAGVDPMKPIEVLAPPVRNFYLPMRGNVRYVDISGEKVYTMEDYKKYQNSQVSNFLRIFEERRQNSEDPFVRDVMDVIKLLVTQSWLYSMKPDRDMLRGIVSVGENTNMIVIRENIAIALKARNKDSPVSDALFYYIKVVQTTIEKHFSDRIKILELNIESNTNLLKVITESSQKTRLNKERDTDLKLLEEYKAYVGFLRVSFRMCLQSYVLNFVDEPYRDTFVLKANGEQDKIEFRTPPLQPGQFEQLLLEAAYEDEKEYKKFSVRRLQNDLISKYLFEFENIIKKEGDDVKKSLTIIKMLIIQSWIHILEPEIKIVHDIISSTEKHDLFEIKQYLINTLKNIITRPPVEEAIHYYFTTGRNKVRAQLDLKIEILTNNINKNYIAIETLKDEHNKLAMNRLNEKYIEKLEEYQMVSQFHDLPPLMILQSFVLDFYDPPHPPKINVKSNSEAFKSFLTPPLGKNSFEQLTFLAVEQRE